MKQKLRNLSAPANIIFAILAVFIFIAPLQWSGKVLGLIPGMEKAVSYTHLDVYKRQVIRQSRRQSTRFLCRMFLGLQAG